jgi:hypothetical protein
MGADAGTAGGLQRAFLAVEGMDPMRDRNAAWQAFETLGDEIFGGAVNPVMGQVSSMPEQRRRPRRERRNR